MNNHEKFIEAINTKKLIKISFDAKEKGIIERICVPFDFGPSRRNMTPNPERYHMYDMDSPDGEHTLSILPEQLLSVEVLDQNFDPADYVKWQPNWFIPRDWGQYS